MDRSDSGARVAEGSSYAARHWRGELSLARSFWINFLLLSLIFSLLFFLPAEDYIAHAPRLVSLAVIAVYLGSILLFMWQAVGTWRSASAHAAGGRKFWARAAQVVIALDVVASVFSTATVIVPQSVEYASIALGQDEYGNYEVSVAQDGRHLVIDGGIGFGLSNAVAAALERNRDVRTIELWSPGGRLPEARRLADLLRARALDTLVIDSCASACTLVFMAGDQRKLAGDARLGFHSGSFPGIAEAQARLLQLADMQYLLQRGVPRDFIARIYDTPPEELWEPSHDELFRARVATGYAMVSD